MVNANLTQCWWSIEASVSGAAAAVLKFSAPSELLFYFFIFFYDDLISIVWYENQKDMKCAARLVQVYFLCGLDDAEFVCIAARLYVVRSFFLKYTQSQTKHIQKKRITPKKKWAFNDQCKEASSYARSTFSLRA